MEKRDKLILLFIGTAVVAILAMEYFHTRNTTVAAVTGDDLSPSAADIGPASAWANVPQRGLLLPPGLGGYIAPKETASTEDSGMYSCGGCGA